MEGFDPQTVISLSESAAGELIRKAMLSAFVITRDGEEQAGVPPTHLTYVLLAVDQGVVTAARLLFGLEDI